MAKKLVDSHPQVSGDKKSLVLSGTGVERRREPTNDFMTSKHPNMVWDFSTQQPFWPDGNPNTLVESTQQFNVRNYRAMNRSGHPYALGVNVGGSPDDGGESFAKPPPAKILK